MAKKYSYIVEFLDKELSPTNTLRYSATCSTLKETKADFKKFLEKNAFSTKGGANQGSILNSKGQVIGAFNFESTISW